MGNTLPKLDFSILPADVAVGVAEQKLLFIGQKLSTGKAKAGELVQNIGNDNSWDTLFGEKSILAGMVRKARKICTDCGYQVQIDALPLDDAEGKEAEATITFDGEATAGGSLYISIGSEYDYTYRIDGAEGATPTQLATLLVKKITEDKKAPFTASALAGVVTVKFAHKGTIGNDTTIFFEGLIEGITLTITKFTKGATDPEINSELLGKIENLRYQGIVASIENKIDDVVTMLDARFNAKNRVMDGVLFVDKTGTLSTLTMAGKKLNSPNLHYQADKEVDATNYKGSSICEFSYIKAVINATTRAVRNSEGSMLSTIVIGQYPNDLRGGAHLNSLPYFNSTSGYLKPLKAQHHWTADEIKELNEAGLSVWDNNQANNGVVMGEQLTTYKTDKAGNPDITWKFLNYRDTESAIREYRFVNFKKEFAQSRMNEDTEKVVRNFFVKVYKVLAGEQYRLLRGGKEALNYYKDNLKISLDFANGRVTVYCKDPIQTQLRECIAFFKVTFDLETGEAV